MSPVIAVLGAVAIVAAVGWLLYQGARVAASDRKQVTDRLRQLDGCWVTFGHVRGRGLILPQEGTLDASTIDQGYVSLVTDQTLTYFTGDIRWVTAGRKSN